MSEEQNDNRVRRTGKAAGTGHLRSKELSMEIRIPFGNEVKIIRTNLPSENITIAQSKNPPARGTWADVVREAISDPIGSEGINKQDLSGKKVAVITDDWARPTPASEVMPLILEELRQTGIEDADITFIVASGMHDPMDREELERKLGKDVVKKYRCIIHDGGDWGNLSFCGISPQGTPIWVNTCVAEADYRIALGRIYPHECYGYEGGYKMIAPGVSGFPTIERVHSFNLSADCIDCVHDNPSRRDADSFGDIVKIDFLISVVVNDRGKPVKAFCGDPTSAHQMGIEYGDREVWGVEIPEKADVTIVSPGSGAVPRSRYDLKVLHRAATVTKESGTVIYVATEETNFEVKGGNAKADESLLELGRKEFEAVLPSLALPEIYRLHERRDWRVSEKEIQWRTRLLRSEHYRRRRLGEIRKREVVLTPDPNAALERTLAGRDRRRVLLTVLPEGKRTFPKERLYRRER